jgi:hypothetical protein
MKQLTAALPALQEHTDFAESKLQRRLIEGVLEPAQVDQLSIIAMAGATSEAMKFEEVLGQASWCWGLGLVVELCPSTDNHLTSCCSLPHVMQNADMLDLARIMARQQPKLSDAQQQNQTRWACYAAASLLRTHAAEYEALIQAMARGGSVVDCIKAIESA